MPWTTIRCGMWGENCQLFTIGTPGDHPHIYLKKKFFFFFLQNVFSPRTVPQSLQNQPSICTPENQNIPPMSIFPFFAWMQTFEMTSRPLLVRKFPSGENTIPFKVEPSEKLSLPRHTLYSCTPVSAWIWSENLHRKENRTVFWPARVWQWSWCPSLPEDLVPLDSKQVQSHIQQSLSAPLLLCSVESCVYGRYCTETKSQCMLITKGVYQYLALWWGDTFSIPYPHSKDECFGHG